MDPCKDQQLGGHATISSDDDKCHTTESDREDIPQGGLWTPATNAHGCRHHSDNRTRRQEVRHQNATHLGERMVNADAATDQQRSVGEPSMTRGQHSGRQ